MRNLTFPLLGVMAGCLVVLPVTAQQTDNSLLLPDAKPGECYAKVITPAKFEMTSEDLVVQEASDRIETDEAIFETVDEIITVKDASQEITVTPTTFARIVEQIEVRAAERGWTSKVGKDVSPANLEVVDQIARSGFDTDSAEPGSCYVEYVTPAQYKSESEKVLVKEATPVIEVIPAVFETVEERVMVKEAASEIVDVPAVFRTETESVMVEPARSVWKEDCEVMEQVTNATGEVMCLVEVPPRYETLTKAVLEKPATTKDVDIPAVYEIFTVERLLSPATEKKAEVPAEYTIVEKQVQVSEPLFFWLASEEVADDDAVATGREICLTARPAEYVEVEREIVDKAAEAVVSEIPAITQTIAVQRLTAPAAERRITIPAQTKAVSRRVQVAPASVEWKQVLCKINMTPKVISSLQKALKREGYDPGPVDGVLGKGTLRAMEQYQTTEGIDRGGMTLELLEHLNIKP